MAGLFEMGFTFVEVGSVTLRPQPGDAQPWSFCLTEDWGVINRCAFNSEGVKRVDKHLREYVASTADSDDGPMGAVLRDKSGQHHPQFFAVGVGMGVAAALGVGAQDGRAGRQPGQE